jgi:hypothetical protein
MTHRFKRGDAVYYSPAGRAQSAARGTYTVTALLPENDGQPEYRIKHHGEDYERVAQEGELSRE